MRLSDIFDGTWVMLVYLPMLFLYLFWWLSYMLIRKRKWSKRIILINAIIHVVYITALVVGIFTAERVEAPIYLIFPILTGIHTLLLLIFSIAYRMTATAK